MRSGVRVSGHGRTMPIYSGFRASSESLSPKDLLDGSRFDEIKNGSEIHPCGDAKTSDALRSRPGRFRIGFLEKELLIHETMSFMDGELHFSVGVLLTRRIKLG